MNNSSYIIDQQLGIQVDPTNHYNACNTLGYLKHGLGALYSTIKPQENLMKEKYQDQYIVYQSIGYNSEYPRELYLILPSLFHWFGVSVCNYARLAGFIVAKEQGHFTDMDIQYEPAREQIKKACDKYINSIIELEKVFIWRNKVAAHFAITSPKPEDNISTMEASIIYPVGLVNGIFKTSPFTLSLCKGDEENSYNSEIPQWSLTETFETLADRFWPDIKFN